MAHRTFRFSDDEELYLTALETRIGAGSKAEVVRTALRELGVELARREERTEALLVRLEQLLPAFDRAVVDQSGFDPRRERAFVRVDNVTYVEEGAVPYVFAQRLLDDGTLEKTVVEQGGENEAKRIWMEPVRFEA